MNDGRSFERIVAEQVAGEPGATPLPDDFYTDIHAYASRTRQRPEWLALIKEPPMRLANALAVGSPTVRAAAILAATLLLAVIVAAAGIAGTRLLAADGAIVVDASGGGDYTLLLDAIAAATDGDTITIRPGTYETAASIDKDLVIRGDGPREDIVIVAPDDGPTYEPRLPFTNTPTPFALALVDADVELSSLTFRGPASRLIVDGGSSTITDVWLDDVGITFAGTGVVGGLVVTGGSTTTIVTSTLERGGSINVSEASTIVVGDSDFIDGPAISGAFGEGTIIRGNRFTGEANQAISFLAAASSLVEDNLISERRSAITVGIAFADGDGHTPVIRANEISGARTAIGLTRGGGWAPDISGNRLRDNQSAIEVVGASGSIDQNTLLGNRTGITIRDATLEVAGNEVRDGVIGIFVDDDASAILRDNVVCGHQNANLVVQEGATADIDDSNEICPDPDPA